MSLKSTQKKDNNIVELEIAVGAEELKAATEKVYRRKGKTITVPGFRKGKAPRQIIEKMYGEGVFVEDAVNDLYPAAYSAAVDEAGIEPVDRADVEILDLDKETGFTFKATVTVKPEVSIKDYKGIKAEKVVSTVTEESIDAEIGRMRDRNARIISVEDRPAEDGDTTIIDFEGFVDDKPFDGGKGEDFELVLGSGSFIDNFEDQIAGHKLGDEFDVNVTFPEAYHSEELQGKPALFKVKLKEIKGKELPELDDEFVKDVSEFNTLQELRDDIRKNMQETFDKNADTQLENTLIDEIIQNLEGDIPECMYTGRVEEMVRDFEYRLSSQGMNMQLYLQYTGMDEEAFRATFRPEAERQVKIRLALEKIAQLESLEVSDEEIEKEYERLAEQYKMEIDKIKGFISLKDVAGDMKTTKAIDLVRENAVITEVKAENKKDEEEKQEEKKAPAKKTAKAKAEETEEEGEKPAKKPAAKKPAAKKPAAKKAEPKDESSEG